MQLCGTAEVKGMKIACCIDTNICAQHTATWCKRHSEGERVRVLSAVTSATRLVPPQSFSSHRNGSWRPHGRSNHFPLCRSIATQSPPPDGLSTPQLSCANRQNGLQFLPMYRQV